MWLKLGKKASKWTLSQDYFVILIYVVSHILYANSVIDDKVTVRVIYTQKVDLVLLRGLTPVWLICAVEALWN